MQYAPYLSADDEVAVGLWGQSNGNPKGTRTAGLTEAPYLVPVTSGYDLSVTAISGNTVTVAETLVEDALIGQELRLILPKFGQSTCPAHVGVGIVTDNTATQLTMAWSVSPSIPAAATGVHSFAASNKVSYTAHAYENGDRVVFTGSPLPAEITAGTTYYVRNKGTNDFELATTLGGSAFAFSTAGTGSTITPTIGAYTYWRDGTGMSYPNVRVLTPWMPETSGSYPNAAISVPGCSFPASITSYADVGLFLPFTFNEGVEGYGIHNSGGTVSYSSAAGKAVLTDVSLALKTNILVGATFQITGEPSILTVESNTATTVTFTTGWTGSAPSAAAEYEGNVHHYRDNPHSWAHGYGLRYPGQFVGNPAALASFTGSGGAVYNRPRGQLAPSFSTVSGSGASATPANLFSVMLPMAWQLSARLGRRVNVVSLCVEASGIVNPAPAGGVTLGWWTAALRRDWQPAGTGNLMALYQRWWAIMAPAALVAEGSSSALRAVVDVGFQGESECDTEEERQLYGSLLSAHYAAQRRFLTENNLSAYPDYAPVPCVHAQLLGPWSGPDAYVAYNMDVEGVVQDAIIAWAAKTPGAATFSVADAAFNIDGHFTGAGAAIAGKSAASAAMTLIEELAATSTDDAGVEIANIALSVLGHAAHITSLDVEVDQSEEAAACAQFYTIARDAVLDQQDWTFVQRKIALVEIPKDDIVTEWDYAYALPSNFARAVAVLPENASDDYQMPPTEYPQLRAPAPVPFAIERDSDGARVLYTNEQNAKLRYTLHVNATAEVPARFKLAVAHNLAALIAGQIVKGDAGAAMGDKALAKAEFFKAGAATQDAGQHGPRTAETFPWNR